ncbi:MFS transporter [Candidatus Woesearchaeota archaeon]|nr:MFS transporter [Candidatus Woesearchaeota archaeon]
MKKEKDKIRKSLGYSILDGAFYSAMVGFGESFFSVFAVFLRASITQIGLLGSLPQALGSVSQLFSNKLIALFKSRKNMILIFAFFQALMYIPVMLVFFLGEMKVFHLIFFVCIYWILGSILSPAWSSWMGDLVDENRRGFYFGKRNKIAGFASFISFLIGGFILQKFNSGKSYEYIGFVIIFTLAFFSRLVSVYFLSKKYEPGYVIEKKAYFSFIDFIKQATFRNFGLFVLYMSFMNFSVNIAAPFFTAYMLYDLKMSYIIFTVVSATSMIVKYLAMPVWGQAADRFGSIKVLSITGLLTPSVPLLWLFSTKTVYLIIVQVYSGLVWAGFEIASFKFIFDSTSLQKRALCVAYYNVLTGVAIFFGAIIGSFLIKVNNFFWSKFLFVFLISFILRYITSLFFIPKIKEVRPVEKISAQQLILNIITTMPTQGIIYKLIPFKKDKNR